jgi:hypothetical protein
MEVNAEPGVPAALHTPPRPDGLVAAEKLDAFDHKPAFVFSAARKKFRDAFACRLLFFRGQVDHHAVSFHHAIDCRLHLKPEKNDPEKMENALLEFLFLAALMACATWLQR